MQLLRHLPSSAVALGLVAALAAPLAARAAEPPPKILVGIPDLAVEKIEYEVVKRQTWADGVTPCQIFNLNATLANLGAKASQEFRVRVDRKKPHWELACLECSVTERSLAPNERRVLTRQFNNCGEGASNEFRVVLDPLDKPDAKPINNSMEKTFLPPPVMRKPPPVVKEKPEG